MPFLRFSRDKRGYENTYVLHTYRRGGRSRPSLLYWFRTPPGVKVGRLPLDAAAIRAIEENNLDLSFDWTKMLKVRPASKPAQTHGTSAQMASDRKRPPRGIGRRSSSAGTAKAIETQPLTPEVEPRADDMIAVETSVELTPDVQTEANEDAGDGPGAEWQHPVVVLMGDETLARLRARYAEIQVRINEKLEDAVTGDAMRSRAEALNPDRWKTVEEAVRGIETFESEVEAIKGLLGRRRPRTRKGGRGSQPVDAGTGGIAPQPVAADEEGLPAQEVTEGPGGEPRAGEPVSGTTSDQLTSDDVKKV